MKRFVVAVGTGIIILWGSLGRTQDTSSPFNLSAPASSLSVTPVGCDAGQFAVGIQANGNAICATSPAPTYNHLEIDGSVKILGPISIIGNTETKGGIALNGPGDAGWAGGYLRIPCPVNDAGIGWTPPMADCTPSDTTERGRICIGGLSTASGTLWICTGLGWEELIAPP